MIEIKKAFARASLFFAGVSLFELAKLLIGQFVSEGYQDGYALILEVFFILILIFLSLLVLERAFDPAVGARWLLGKGDIVEVMEEEPRPRGVALRVRLPYKNVRPMFVKFTKKQNVKPGEGQYLFDGRKLKPLIVEV